MMLTLIKLLAFAKAPYSELENLKIFSSLCPEASAIAPARIHIRTKSLVRATKLPVPINVAVTCAAARAN